MAEQKVLRFYLDKGTPGVKGHRPKKKQKRQRSGRYKDCHRKADALEIVRREMEQ